MRRYAMSDSKTGLIGRLFLRNSGQLLRILRPRVGSDQAQDLLQETFARALRQKNFDAVVEPSAYLRQTARNLAEDAHRRRGVESRFLIDGANLDAATTPEPTPADALEHKQRLQLLAKAIDALPPKCREVVILRMQDGLSQDEIAQRLGVTRKMIERHLRIGILRCRAAIKENLT